ncbi:ATP-dependent RNA helicase-like, partial [Homarus americanus]
QTVAVHHKANWFRGRVKNVIKTMKDQKVEVFLLDYGVTVIADVSSIVCLSPEEWTSVPYQARKVRLFGVTPLSLGYSLTPFTLKVMPKTCQNWDEAAVTLVRRICELKPIAEFVPMMLGPDGCMHGSLTVHINDHIWSNVIPLSPIFHYRSEGGVTPIDLALILVSLKYATWEADLLHEILKEKEEEEMSKNSAGRRVPPDILSSEANVGVEDNSVTQTHQYQLELQNDAALPHLEETLLSSEGMDGGKDEGLMQRSFGQGRALKKLLGSTSSRHSAPQSSDVCDNPLNSRIADHVSSESTNSSLSFEATTQPTVVETKHCGHSSSSLFELEEIPAPVKLLESKLMASRLVQAPLTEDGTSDNERYLKCSSVTDKMDTRSTREEAASLYTRNYTDVCLNSSFVGSTSRSQELKGGIGQRIIKKREDSSETSPILPSCQDKEGWNLSQVADIVDQQDKGLTATREESQLTPSKNSRTVLRKKSVDDTHLTEPCENNTCNGIQGREDTAKGCDKVKPECFSKTDFPLWVSSLLLETVQAVGHPRPNNSSDKLDPAMKSLTSVHLSQNTENGDRNHDAFNKDEENGQLFGRKNIINHLELSTCFISDSRDIWSSEMVSDFKEGEFAHVFAQNPNSEALNIAKLFRVFVAGESRIAEEEVILNEYMISSTLNSHIVNVLSNVGMKASRLQAYAWPAITRGSSTIIVGDRSCGKTVGYVVPLISTILDTWRHISLRLVPGIGPVMVVICSNWRSAKCTAESIVSLLPADVTFKVMTAWGGCGHKEAKDTKMLLHKGCDILVTTPPCLVRLLTSVSVTKGESLGPEEKDMPATSLARCCHLVIDDAHISLKLFSEEIKQLIISWGEVRKEQGRSDLNQQIVLVSSKWTKLFDSLTRTLLPLVDPTVIVSAPGEAAIGARVLSKVHLVPSGDASLIRAVELVQNLYRRPQKNIIFVRDDMTGDKIKALLEAASIYSLIVPSTILFWNLRKIVYTWHKMQAVTLVVSRGAELLLLQHDLADADNIFHTYIAQPVSSFTLKYAFMVDKFSPDLNRESRNCESHVIVSKAMLRTVPNILTELKRVCGHIDEEVAGSVTEEGKLCKNKALCYYLKAYGRCPIVPYCGFRHEVKITDIPQSSITSGEVTFDVVKVLNASRYLVRLTEYRDKARTCRLDMKNHYISLFLDLQQHFSDPAKREPLTYVEPGLLCAVEDKGSWARAQIISVNYSNNIPMIAVFLVDEGKELTVELKAACSLPPNFAAFPELIVEVYLCHIKPLDHDKEWTLEASQFVHEVFTSGSKNKFVGQIVLALGQTIWLSPVKELVQVGKLFVSRGSIRGKLITHGYGIDNPTHLKILKQLCTKAGISLHDQDLLYQNGEKSALSKTSGKTHHTQSETELMSKSIEHKDNLELEMPTHCVIKDKLRCGTITDTCPEEDQKTHKYPSETSAIILTQEDLPLAVDIKVKIGEVVSPHWFFLLRDDKIASLNSLESGLEDFIPKQESSCKEGDDEDLQLDKNTNLLPYQYCVAKFSDDRYYRARVISNERDGGKKVFFVDHGETLVVPSHQVHASPRSLVEKLPAQAVLCSLAHITIPSHLQEKAITVFWELCHSADTWTAKAVEIQETADGQIYSVELTGISCNPPKEMWRELVEAGVAVGTNKQVEETKDKKHESLDTINTAFIEGKEAADFLLSIPSIRVQIERDKKEFNEQISKTTKGKINGDKATNDDVSRRDSSEAPEREKNSPTVAEKNIDSKVSCSSVVEARDTNKVHQERTNNAYVPHRNRKAFEQTSAVFYEKCLLVPPLQAVENVSSKLYPETSWNQNEESVFVNIHLMGVEIYKCRFGSSHLTFMTVKEDRFYIIDETLQGNIDPDKSTIQIRGVCVSVTLWKAEKGKWGSLLANRKRRHWLRAEYQLRLPFTDDDDTQIEGEKGGEWCTAKSDAPTKEYGGLPAGISESDVSDDEISEEDFIS